MAGNHGFIDGNKRTTLILVNLLIRKSGFELEGMTSDEQNAQMENLILGSVERSVTFDNLVTWFRAHLRALR
jgi:death on curing protein